MTMILMTLSDTHTFYKVELALILQANFNSSNLDKYLQLKTQMGSFRSTPDTNKHTISQQGVNLTYSVSHMCGWRNYMEDAHISVSPLSDKKNSLFAVFDGHGGAQVAVFVQRHFVKQLQANSNYKKGHYEPALKQTFLKMDELLREEKGKKEIKQIQKQMRQIGNGPNYEEQSHAGCTANVWLVTPQFVYVANSGDSRGVACINGNSKQMSKDHKPDDKQQLDRIRKAGGEVSLGRVNGNLNLSRALGDLEYKQNTNLTPEQQMITANPDIQKVKNQNIDFVIIGCDGIWEVKSSDEMVKWVKKRLESNKQLSNVVQDLLDELVAKDGANSQYGMDNMSTILIKFNKKK